METSAVAIIVQAGAVGLCFYLIYIVRKMFNGRMDQLLEIIKQNSQAMTNNAVTNQKLSDKMDELIRR